VVEPQGSMWLGISKRSPHRPPDRRAVFSVSAPDALRQRSASNVHEILGGCTSVRQSLAQAFNPVVEEGCALREKEGAIRFLGSVREVPHNTESQVVSPEHPEVWAGGDGVDQ